MPTKDDFMRDCCLSTSFIHVIDELTFVDRPDIQSNQSNKGEIAWVSSHDNAPLLANMECRFFGRYYETTEKQNLGMRFWIGYDYGKNENQRFYISFDSRDTDTGKQTEKSKDKADEIKKALEFLQENYEAEYCERDKHYWYNVTLDIHLLYLPNSQAIGEIKARVNKILNQLLNVSNA